MQHNRASKTARRVQSEAWRKKDGLNTATQMRKGANAHVDFEGKMRVQETLAKLKPSLTPIPRLRTCPANE